MEKLSIEETPMKATCHCGAISVTAPNMPKLINDCQCTICRRYGAAWAYYDAKVVDIKIKEGSSAKKYVWGDGMLSFNFCDHCGCMCYWYPYPDDLPKSAEGNFKMGINTKMVEPAELKDINRTLNNDVIFAPKRTKEAAHAEDRATY